MQVNLKEAGGPLLLQGGGEAVPKALVPREDGPHLVPCVEAVDYCAGPLQL